MVKFAAIACISMALAACATPPGTSFRAVDQAVNARTGRHVRWNQNTAEDRAADARVKELLATDLTPDAAVDIALLNNHALQATFEDIGIAQADLVQAGLLKNPTFAASWRFPDRSPRQVNAEYEVAADVLDIFMLPLRKKIAANRLARTQSQVAAAVLELIREVRIAAAGAQAQERLLEIAAIEFETREAAAELARAQHKAGNIDDLDLAQHEAALSQARVDMLHQKHELTAARENLARLMGIQAPWHLAATADVPPADPPLNNIETVALEHRLDLKAARQGAQALAQAAGLIEDYRYITTLRIGVNTEHEPGGPNLTGPTLEIELPIFDQGDARIAEARAQYRKARHELLALTANIRSEVREAADRLSTQRQLVDTLGNQLLPQRNKIVQLTLLHYNGMLKSPFELLAARQNELAAQRAHIEAIRDYWIARARLEHAVSIPQHATQGEKP